MLSAHYRPPKDKGKFFAFQSGLDVAIARSPSSTYGHLHKEVKRQVSRPESHFDWPVRSVQALFWVTFHSWAKPTEALSDLH